MEITLVSERLIPLGRMLFIPKQNLTKDQLKIKSTGPYRLMEKEDNFVVQNLDVCRSIMVTVTAEVTPN